MFKMRIKHLHHQADDVARGTELAIYACCSELTEEVFVQVPLCVSFCERQFVYHINSRNKQCRLLYHQLGVFHVLTELSAVYCHALEMFKNLITDMRKHFLSSVILKFLPS